MPSCVVEDYHGLTVLCHPFSFIMLLCVSNGVRDKIQVSLETHELLVAAGKGHWTRPREDAIHAKGKGTLQTYWLNIYSKKVTSTSGSSSTGRESDSELANAPAAFSSIERSPAVVPEVPLSAAKHDRLIDWIVEVLGEQVKRIILTRKSKSGVYQPSYPLKNVVIALDEVVDAIQLSHPADQDVIIDVKDLREVQIDPEVAEQLRQYVSIIASTYRNNAFHNFEHACHVTMAASKFLKRIVATTCGGDVRRSKKLSEGLSYTYSINADPLVALAILISALVHDVDHRGVSNTQLNVEEPEMASFYRSTSIAEQNSLDIAWDLLMRDQFAALQRCLFASEVELKRFRQVLVNAVLATDIFDKELNDVRKERWNRAFSGEETSANPEINNLRATVVIEHIIQAADVAHTMQHWHVYCKWNKRLFQEMHRAYKAGRMKRDPTDLWYLGELGFFDNYILPLANKFKDCHVFGVSSDECLNYAIKNRGEWESRGRELVIQMAAEQEAENRGHGQKSI